MNILLTLLSFNAALFIACALADYKTYRIVKRRKDPEFERHLLRNIVCLAVIGVTQVVGVLFAAL